MNENERQALSALRFDWAPTHEDVWAPLEAHVNGLNGHVADAVLASFDETKKSTRRSPLGVAILGQKGAGKTHLLRWVRDRVQHDRGYFFLVGLLHGKDFWQNIVHALLSGLRRPGPMDEDQLSIMLSGLAEWAQVDPKISEQISGIRPVTPDGLEEFVVALRHRDGDLGRRCQHTVRALALLGAADFAAQDIGEAYLTSQGEAVPGEWADWGIRPTGKGPQQIASEVTRLLAVTGPSVLAVDQIDTLIAQSAKSTARYAGEQVDVERDLLLEQIGGGLMDLREVMHRTLTIVACLPPSWQLITQRAVASVSDRFRAARRLARVPSAEVGQELIAAWFRLRFEEQNFSPPYPTWPILPGAFVNARRFTPRGLFKRIDVHITSCLHNGIVVPLAVLDELPDDSGPPELPDVPVQQSELAKLDSKFALLRSRADTAEAIDPKTEDVAMPTLLSAGLRAWIEEQGADRTLFALDPPPGARPALHARLRRTLDESTEDEAHWSLRAIAGPHHKAVLPRIERVRVIAGLDPAVPKRKAFLLRTGQWVTGPVTRRKIKEFRAAGGEVLEVDSRDLATFSALAEMLGDKEPALPAWLRQRRPASNTQLFTAIFGATEPDRRPESPDGAVLPPDTTPPPDADSTVVTQVATEEPDPRPDTLFLGNTVDTGTTVRVSLESLRKHTVIFAGSGSGKTVLIRRLVEECALQGVSSIVLDPNNDLSRLGDPWPEPPTSWGVDDAAKADDYLASTDVVVWTPRREAGRPLSLQPLPDFAAVLDDPDEFGLALDTAVAALAPRARVDGTTAKAERGRAVLREALAYLARRSSFGLTGFTDLLAELPDDVTSLAKAQAIAEDMAQTLTAAMINDPLFGGSGVPLDPGVLLTPAAGRRARISVISFIGLPANEQRQSFVNQLQMALFAWIKRHPAGDRPLGGLFVMDEAQTLAPSGAMTACTESTLALASQARKYGLGLIFATQAPRGIHNRIVGNAATQFYGFLNSPVQIAAAKEMASAKSSGIVDISRLTAGQFYAVGEGMPFQKVATPMCLSYHPTSALTAEEVLARARESA